KLPLHHAPIVFAVGNDSRRGERIGERNPASGKHAENRQAVEELTSRLNHRELQYSRSIFPLVIRHNAFFKPLADARGSVVLYRAQIRSLYRRLSSQLSWLPYPVKTKARSKATENLRRVRGETWRTHECVRHARAAGPS